MSDAQFKPGFRFSVRQASLTKKPRNYTIVFELDNECRPLRVGGVKPIIADEIAAQGNEVDNLGDGESICLMGALPTINMLRLAEVVNEALRNDAR